MPHAQATIHRMFELVEPITTLTFSAIPDAASLVLGLREHRGDGHNAAHRRR